MKKLFTLFTLFKLFTLTALLAGCGGGSDAPVAEAEVIAGMNIPSSVSAVSDNSTPTPTSTPTSIPKSIFRDILSKSREMVSGWNGKMYLVYLPSFERYSTGSEDPYRDFVMQTATELDIPIIDIHREVFDPYPDPLSLFPFRMSGHYNAEGYKLIVEAIGKRLEADGYVPIKSKK